MAALISSSVTETISSSSVLSRIDDRRASPWLLHGDPVCDRVAGPVRERSGRLHADDAEVGTHGAQRERDA